MVRNINIPIVEPTGETIKEILEDRGISYEEFAEKIELPLKDVLRILDGKQKVTVDIADRLERFCGVHHSVWLRLEALYRENLELVERENELQLFAKLSDYIEAAEFEAQVAAKLSDSEYHITVDNSDEYTDNYFTWLRLATNAERLKIARIEVEEELA